MFPQESNRPQSEILMFTTDYFLHYKRFLLAYKSVMTLCGMYIHIEIIELPFRNAPGAKKWKHKLLL